MAKKSDAKGPAKGRRKPKTLWVTDERGRRRFLRGMITHELVSHGFAFDVQVQRWRSVPASGNDVLREMSLRARVVLTGKCAIR